jgi:cytochrome c
MSWISTRAWQRIGVPAAALTLFLVWALAISGPAVADPGTPGQDEVVALTRKAVAVIEAQGGDAAREIFNKEGEFKFGEIYVNLIDFKGAWVIYPPRPANVGLNVFNLKDADGRFLIQDIIKVARENDEGWVEYR